MGLAGIAAIHHAKLAELAVCMLCIDTFADVVVEVVGVILRVGVGISGLDSVRNDAPSRLEHVIAIFKPLQSLFVNRDCFRDWHLFTLP